MQPLKSYLTQQGWKKDLSETINDFTRIYSRLKEKIDRKSEQLIQSSQSNKEWIQEQLDPFESIFKKIENSLNQLPQKLPQEIIEQIHLKGNYFDGTNTYEIWGNNIARYSPNANLQGMGPSALFHLSNGALIHDYGR